MQPDKASAAHGRDELWLSSKVGDWIWRELNAGRSVTAVTRELAERVEEMEARRVAI